MPWVRTTQIHPTHHLRSRGGSLTFQIETLGDHPQEEEEEDPRHTPQDHPQEEAEVVEAVEEAEVVEAEVVAVVEAEGEPSHYPDMHLPNRLKSF